MTSTGLSMDLSGPFIMIGICQLTPLSRDLNSTAPGSIVTRTSLAGLTGVGYALLSSSTGMVRIPAVWRAYSAKPG